MKPSHSTTWSRIVADYGMVAALVLLSAYYSWATYAEQYPTGAAAGGQVAGQLLKSARRGGGVLIVAHDTPDGAAFIATVERRLAGSGVELKGPVVGTPADLRRQLKTLADAHQPLDAIACDQSTAVLERVAERFPTLGNPAIVAPHSYWWPSFLKANNLLNVVSQISIIAVIAIGMTAVIITAGIDLSVGSLIALAAVVTAILIRDCAGGEQAGVLGMTLCSLAAIAVCAAVGLFSGSMITFCGIPPFIVTLSMMLVTSGLAYQIAHGQSIAQVPDSYVWLGSGTSLGIPNAVLLMAALYVMAHVAMTRMRLGRYVYAVGGNAEAARLSGVPVRRVLLAVYALSGALAGLGGIIMASRLKSGSPTYGEKYELYVIAATVVGGTSLAGGEGKMFGTLIGALIIAVIQNGMNLTGVQGYTQTVVFGAVILGAVLLDRLKTIMAR